MTAPRYTPDMGVTQSMLTDWLACRYRSHLALKEGWEPKARKTSFRFGTLFHDILEHLYAGIREGRFRQTQLDAVADLLAPRIREQVEENLRTASPGDDRAEIEDEAPLAEALLGGYLKRWAADDWAREWVAVEGEFDTDFGGFRLRGKRDGVYAEGGKGKGKGGKGLWLLETKTKSQISEDDLDLALAFDFQSLYYLLTLELEPRRTLPVHGCLYNIVRKPALRPYAAGPKRVRPESRTEFLDRIRADIDVRPDHYFKRFEIVFPQKVRDEFLIQLSLQLADFRAWTAGDLPTYRNPGACITRYKCPYLEHCSSGDFAGYARTKELFPELSGPKTPAKPTGRR